MTPLILYPDSEAVGFIEGVISTLVALACMSGAVGLVWWVLAR
jgi:hypothetical protein